MDWSTYLGPQAKTSGDASVIRAFGSADPVVDREHVRSCAEEWQLETGEPSWLSKVLHRGQSIELFQASLPPQSGVLLTARISVKAVELSGRAYLEIYSRVNGREYFSRSYAFGQVVESAGDWQALETPFLATAETPVDHVRLNVVVEGAARLQIKDAQLLASPLAEG